MLGLVRTKWPESAAPPSSLSRSRSSIATHPVTPRPLAFSQSVISVGRICGGKVNDAYGTHHGPGAHRELGPE